MKNYLKHSRPKGSRNGYTTMKDYKPVGTPAKGKLVNGRYVYEEDLKNGKLPSLPKDFSIVDYAKPDALKKTQNVNKESNLVPASSSNKKAESSKTGTFVNGKYVFYDQRSPQKADTFIKSVISGGNPGRKYMTETLAPIATDQITKARDEMARSEGYKDYADQLKKEKEEHELSMEYYRKSMEWSNSPEGKAELEKMRKINEQREKEKAAFIKEREAEFKKTWKKKNSHNIARAFLNGLLGHGAGNYSDALLGQVDKNLDWTKEYDAWEAGYDSYEDMQKGKRSKKYTGWKTGDSLF